MRSETSALLWIIALAFAVAVSRPAAADDQQECLKGSKETAVATIAACSRAIESGDYSKRSLARLYHQRGYAWSWTSFTDRVDRAFEDYTEAIRIDPKAVDSLLNRSQIYNQRHDHDRAIADVNQAFENGLSHYGQQVGYGERGYAYQAKGDNDRAIADYDQLIALDPKYALAYYNRATAYQAKGDLDRAISDSSQAIALYPGFKAAYSSRAYAYRTKGDFDRAIADYDQMIALDPHDKDAYGNRASAYWSKGDFRGAMANAGPDQAPSWFATAALLAAALWLCGRTGMLAPGRFAGRTMVEICEHEIIETRNKNAALEKIAMALEKRSSG